MKVLLQSLLDKFPVDADFPSQIQSIGRQERRGSVDSVCEGGIRSSSETFQSVWSRGTSGEINQLIIGRLIFLAVGLVYGKRVT